MTILFVAYINRSGSTYLANILSSSEKVCVCPEGDILVQVFLEDPGKKFILSDPVRKYLSEIFRLDHKLVNWKLKGDIFTFLEKRETNLEAFQAILEYYRNSDKPGATHVLFKAERLSALMEKIVKAASSQEYQVQFLSIIRDPRAVFASQKSTRLPGSEDFMAKNPVLTAWKWKNSIIREIKFPCENESHIILKYESLIKEPDRTLERISGFTSLNLSSCKGSEGDLAPRLSEDERMIHSRITHSPERGRIDAWKSILSPREVYLVESTGSPMMEKLGYGGSGLKFRLDLEFCKIFTILALSLRSIRQKICFRLANKYSRS